MALTKTARLELINPYQKYGLTRRPTFDEIVGLVSENDKLLRPFPNREATRFRNSPQGSFFDGSDHLDLLKEQQTRILDRQMREAILRKEAHRSGGTLGLMKYQQNSGTSTPMSVDIVDVDEFASPRSSVNSEFYRVAYDDFINKQKERDRLRKEEVAMAHEKRLVEDAKTLVNSMTDDAVSISRSKNELPPLESIPSDETEEELIPADETKTEKDLPPNEK